MLQEMLDSISEREAKILRLRYGIGIEQPMTLSEIGEEMGLTRERIRQIENNALRTLHAILARKRGYVDET
jgi:RNA polymerase primary sigma factor